MRSDEARELDAACARLLGYDIEWRLVEYDEQGRGFVEIQSWYEAHPTADRQGLSRAPCMQIRHNNRLTWQVIDEYSCDANSTRELLDCIERYFLVEPYMAALSRIMEYRSTAVDGMHGMIWFFLDATPEQHARAFIQVMEQRAS